MASIPLGGRSRLHVQVDDEDVAVLARFKWREVPNARTTYAATTFYGRTVYMHRLVLGYDGPREVDHVNRNGLDNRKANLRLATRGQNMANGRARVKRAKKSSKYKGVSWHDTNTGGCWRAEVEKQIDGKRRRFIKYASTELEAARLYDELARAHFGTFASVNGV